MLLNIFRRLSEHSAWLLGIATSVRNGVHTPNNSALEDGVQSTEELSPDGLQLWHKARQKNFNNSWIYRLPTELLFQIVEFTSCQDDSISENITLLVLRRTSFRLQCIVFLIARHTNLRKLDMAETGYYTVFNGRNVWPVYVLPKDSEPLYSKLLELISRDANGGYCRDCRESRTSGQFDKALKDVMHASHDPCMMFQGKRKLWCSGCSTLHLPVFFSHAQRRVATIHTKETMSRGMHGGTRVAAGICIGTEGKLVLCSHNSKRNASKASDEPQGPEHPQFEANNHSSAVTMSWADMLVMSARFESHCLRMALAGDQKRCFSGNSSRTQAMCITCNHPEHAPPDAVVNQLATPNGNGNMVDRGRSQVFRWPSISFLQTCERDNSRKRKREPKPGEEAQQSEQQNPNNQPNDTSTQEEKSPSKVPGAASRTRIRVAKGEYVERDISVSWAVPLFRHNPATDPPMTRQILRSRLQQAAAGAAAGSGPLASVNFCPHVSPLDINKLLLPFEPGQCACFDAADAINHADNSSANAPDLPYRSCHGTGRLHNHDRDARAPGESAPGCCRCIKSSTPTCLIPSLCRLSSSASRSAFLPQEPKLPASQVISHASHQYVCAQCMATYSWVRDRHKWVHLCCRLSLADVMEDSPSHEDWIKRLDPATWEADSDMDLKYVTWCPEGKLCKTTTHWYKLLK